MWFISRCISIDSLNSCFQQQKNKTSYDFCLCRGGSGILAKRNDEDDCESIPKKHLYDNHYQQQQQQHIRRRLPKRYSDIVGPSTNRMYLPRKDSIKRDKQTTIHSLSQYNHQYTSFKTKSNENLYIINSHNKKSRDLLSTLSKIETKDNSFVTHRYNSKNKRISTINSVDLLAHRMQAAMSTELMHSLDRNFVFGDKKPLSLLNCSHINRSQSFHTSTTPTNKWWNKSFDKEHYYHVIPRVKHRLDDEQKSIGTISSLDELTPDYDDDDDNINHNHNNIIIRRINNNNNNDTDEIDEEPIIDYNDSKLTFTSDIEDKLITPPTLYDLGVTSSFIVQQTSITPTSETFTQEQSSIPPTPPPLPNTTIQQKKLTFRCRTIADKITADHKLILKDNVDTITEVSEEIPIVPQVEEEYQKKSCPITNIISKPCYLHLSKELLEKTTLRKVSHPISRSYSTYGSISQLNDHNTESTTLRGKTSIINEQSLDGLSSSATTSIIIENEYEHRTSSKIYNDYKRRASLITVPTDNTLSHSYSHSAIIHPMHTHIGVRSSTSSSSNDKLNDNNLSSKKMNIRVINQLNEHLSTRFRQQQQQQQDIYLTKDNNIISENIIDHQSYDPPPEQIKDDIQTNVYDEPNHIEITNTSTIKCSDIPTSAIPPPPPPLPVGGFRPIVSQLNRPLSSQRTSIITLPRETNGSDFGCSTGTSTISSKLSDARILRELRTNPLFTKAKQHLEIETDLNDRQSNESKCYLRLDKCSKGISSTIQNDNSNESLNNNNNNNNNTNMETFIMRPDELNAIMNNTTKRTKSLNSTTKDINQITSRSLTKSFLQTQCRQSELELIFQKRAQRNEQQNPT